jgi:hypothetical protein
MKIYKILIWIIVFLFAVILAGCGGGSSGDSGGSSGGTGSVAVILTDGPADDYEELIITITQVTLIPASGSNLGPATVYRSAQGCQIDLLEFRDDEFLFTLKDGIPAGTYEKIRLYVEDIEPNGGPCDDLEVKLPSGKIDLVPGGTFEVEQGETLAIRLDIDANKSINFHEAGQSGKCIFRPVVFVDVEPIDWMQRCPKILKGTLEEFIGEDPIRGFRLKLDRDRGTLNVYLSGTIVIFDEAGIPGGIKDLEKGQTVWVRGKLDADGHFQATEVAIGGVLVLKGTVESAVDEHNIFTLARDPNQPVTDETIQVTLSGETLILTGCDDKVTKSAITPGLPARVAGKLSLSEDTFQAIAIFLKPLSGELIAVQKGVEHNGTEGMDLTIKTDAETDVAVFLPERGAIRLVGDGDVPVALLCPGRQVNAVIDPDESDTLGVLTASEIKVQSDHLVGYIDEIDRDERIIYVNGQQIHVQDDAVVMDLRGSGDRLRDFKHINEGDKISCFGLTTCEADASGNDFYAFVILLIED